MHSRANDSDSDSDASGPSLPSRRLIFDRIKDNTTPSITLSINADDSSTLLSTNPSPSQHDSHLEVIIRVLAVLSLASKYDPAFVSILAPLYLIYAQANNATTPSTFAEEEVFCAMQAILERTSPVHLDTTRCLDTVGCRLKWADEHLHSILLEHDLDPATPLYTFRWLASILSADLPPDALLPLWDVIFAAPDTVDTLTDLSCAILLASKKHLFRSTTIKGLWDASDDVDFVRALTFLRAIPLAQIGGTDAILGAYTALRTTLPPSTPKSDLSSRLANLTLSVGPQKIPSTFTPTAPRALKLQEKARRASNPMSARRTSSSSVEATLSPPPPTSGLYRIGSRQGHESPRRALVYDQMVALAVGLGRRPHIRSFAPLATLIRRYANYPDHVPLGRAQNALLAVGSGVVGVATSRGGKFRLVLC